MIAKHTKLLIIGAGVHGMTLAISYMEQGGCLEDLIIVDRLTDPLANWKQQTTSISMSHLRSTRVHHVSSNPHALKQFASRYAYRSNHFKDTFGRPSLELFNDHAETSWNDYRLQERFLGDERVLTVRKDETRYHIRTDRRLITADAVIVAIGQSGHVVLPEWTDEHCRHVFMKDPSDESDEVIIVGGGITALHYVVKRAKQGHRVTLVTRRPLEVSQFDADRQFMGPKGLDRFHRLKDDWTTKRSFLVRERKPGSAPNDLVLKVKRLIQSNAVTHLIGEVERKDDSLFVNGDKLSGEEVVCCTGIRPHPVNETFLQPLMEQFNLPLTPCGTPVLTEQLEWAPGLYLTGPYADLIIGPFARAVYGGQEAARRILPQLLATQKSV
ncbi:NAD(P)-binding domain-containing protein [Exiguobacterium profundum]|uniref:NAD(P)-binding domain-containing protein n=1 Tax=Exiguobacterium profundum TaxID=307643 RepID=UPI00391AE0CF